MLFLTIAVSIIGLIREEKGSPGITGDSLHGVYAYCIQRVLIDAEAADVSALQTGGGEEAEPVMAL